MFKKILLAYDGSEYANKAFNYVLELAKMDDCEVYVVSVATIPEFVNSRDEVDEALNAAKLHYGKLLGNARRLANEKGVKVFTEVIVGHPVDSVIRFAENHGCDLIVVGEKGTSGLKRYIIGNVAENIARHAKCSVLIVK
ncbi:nucleotide-binding universal stress UspA family protein [Caldanaerobacter subterraneus subsp. tengcongensis MB4]|uniref:Universal stress protein UspA and related nucleotide-binding proteins n=4 Tax=Caldanaerobacter subterraneus TaxID=911092 RepID=Q8R8U1_CALS4|nr:universal stress protein [Caldanaerobacter subterraneus]AAM25083.1 Universal stress protein UspA and related nucleotide-binding proteins [Caldanaerobacter subterraneus subsp. tengcongensis MB4]ERM91402.1 universal stress protein UspA [Caldanaerobacter subterraneus subsp. yonseiensis KB-1]KKC29147.1 universal stress protein UspA-like nucleotide-binding protein [Caldanaerobacter subterraneus subsp. pacificus DSM 12653]MCS3915329.1 nucleotide-binding universal stress UspA family protein [Caldan